MSRIGPTMSESERALRAVLALHAPVVHEAREQRFPVTVGEPVVVQFPEWRSCSACSILLTEGTEDEQLDAEWPCSTLQAIAEATGLEPDVLASWAARHG